MGRGVKDLNPASSPVVPALSHGTVLHQLFKGQSPMQASAALFLLAKINGNGLLAHRPSQSPGCSVSFK